ASTLPFSICMSSSATSAIRRSRKDCEARSTATAAARSHDSLLVPTSSITLYTLSAMAPSSANRHRRSSGRLAQPCQRAGDRLAHDGRRVGGVRGDLVEQPDDLVLLDIIDGAGHHPGI